MVSVIQGHKNPFRDEIIDLNEAQLDFILEMESIDHPDQLSFKRGSGAAEPEIKAAWDSVLRGPAKQDYYGASLVAAIKRATSKLSKQPRLGITRGKKP